MRRLNPARFGDDRGAVAVVVSLLMVTLLGFAAISIDVGRIYAEKRQLQNGADAAALAVAQTCGCQQCGTPTTTARTIANANANDGISRVDSLRVTGGTVDVQVSALTPEGGTVEHSFAPVFGQYSSDVVARARARCGAVSGGTARIPLAFSYCAFAAQTGGALPSGTTARTILLPKKDETGCTGRSGNPVPGGFGWLAPDTGVCAATVFVSPGQTPANTGNVPPQPNCDPADFVQYQNKTLLLPIYDAAGGNGTNAWYRIYAFAAFKVTGYHFAGQYSWNAPCSGPDRCIRGYFLQFADVSADYRTNPTAPDLGGRLARLELAP